MTWLGHSTWHHAGTWLMHVLPMVLSALAYLVAMVIGKRLVNGAITRAFRRQAGVKMLNERRARTLEPLIKSIISYLISFFAAVMVLDAFHVSTTSIVATASLLSLAVGFGAQNLVKDVITGFFILFEDQFGVGDHVTVAGVSGVVEEVGLRVTRLRDPGGQLYIVPNGQVAQVTNHSADRMRVSVTVTVPKAVAVDKAIEALADAAKAAHAGGTHWAEPPTVLGVTRVGEGSYDVELAARATSRNLADAERNLRLEAKRALEVAGIG